MDACPRGAEYLCNNNIFKSPMFLKSPCIKTWGVSVIRTSVNSNVCLKALFEK
jgi:hypothetical protein